jgi:hypothetical protein
LASKSSSLLMSRALGLARRARRAGPALSDLDHRPTLRLFVLRRVDLPEDRRRGRRSERVAIRSSRLDPSNTAVTTRTPTWVGPSTEYESGFPGVGPHGGSVEWAAAEEAAERGISVQTRTLSVCPPPLGGRSDLGVSSTSPAPSPLSKPQIAPCRPTRDRGLKRVGVRKPRRRRRSGADMAASDQKRTSPTARGG